jgi:DNA-binding transcriptional LysR family regulator
MTSTNDLSTIKIFLQVADDGSFSATARRRNMSVSSIARQVSGLEERLGVRLLNRTTRNQSLTEIGQIYYEKMKQLLSDFDGVHDLISSFRGTVRGTLRIHLRTSIARLVIPHLKSFSEQYSDITLDLTLTEDRADLVSEGVDVAVWLGSLEDSNYIARRLTSTERIIVGSKAYLESVPPIETPYDLANHNCITFIRSQFSKDIWRLIRGEEVLDVAVNGNLKTRSGWALYDYVINDLGIAMIQKWMVLRELQDGSLIRVLPEYDCNPIELDVPLYVVYPHSQGLPLKTRAFVDFLVRVFQNHMRQVEDA